MLKPPISAPISPNNLIGLNYRKEATKFLQLPTGITDAHTHINDVQAAQVLKDVMQLYGIKMVYSMTHFDQISAIKRIFEDQIRFIAIPDYRRGDLLYNVGVGYIERIKKLYRQGVRIVKFWSAPRGVDLARQAGYPGALSLAAEHIHAAMEVAHDLGMVFMVHVADPDIWFANQYSDQLTYGTKVSQYEWLEKLLNRFDNPWIAAHFAGWPEDLTFLSGLLERHSNLYIDASATKWMVRELSKHPAQELTDFFVRFQGGILFGSDIVTRPEHVQAGHQAGSDSRQDAFELYASRYWALRALFETNYQGRSPIADLDYQKASDGAEESPLLLGKHFPQAVLNSLYYEAADKLLGKYHDEVW